jgi:hypothetical protein
MRRFAAIFARSDLHSMSSFLLLSESLAQELSKCPSTGTMSPAASCTF